MFFNRDQELVPVNNVDLELSSKFVNLKKTWEDWDLRAIEK